MSLEAHFDGEVRRVDGRKQMNVDHTVLQKDTGPWSSSFDGASSGGLFGFDEGQCVMVGVTVTQYLSPAAPDGSKMDLGEYHVSFIGERSFRDSLESWRTPPNRP